MRLLSILLYTFLFCLFYSLATPAVAQVEKGRLRLGGVVSASFQKSNTEYYNAGLGTSSFDQKNTAISFGPLVGLFLMDGFELGINPSINWSSGEQSTDQQSYDSKTINFFIGPYVNYYIGSGENGKPFVGLNPKIGWGKGEIEGLDFETGTIGTIETSTKIWSVRVTAGYAIFLNDSYLLSFFAGYEYSNSESEEEDSLYYTENKSNMFTLGVSISTTFKR